MLEGVASAASGLGFPLGESVLARVVWPPVVHLQRDDDDTPTDGYGGNSSRFIEAYLGMDER